MTVLHFGLAPFEPNWAAPKRVQNQFIFSTTARRQHGRAPESRKVLNIVTPAGQGARLPPGQPGVSSTVFQLYENQAGHARGH